MPPPQDAVSTIRDLKKTRPTVTRAKPGLGDAIHAVTLSDRRGPRRTRADPPFCAYALLGLIAAVVTQNGAICALPKASGHRCWSMTLDGASACLGPTAIDKPAARRVHGRNTIASNRERSRRLPHRGDHGRSDAGRYQLGPGGPGHDRGTVGPAVRAQGGPDRGSANPDVPGAA